MQEEKRGLKILVYGAAEFSSTVADLARHCGHEVIGLISDNENDPGTLGKLNDVAQTHPPNEFGLAIGIGYRNLCGRWKAWRTAKALGYSAPPLIHPSAYIADNARIRNGAMIMARAIVDVRVDIGELAVAWPGACINHDAKVGDNTFLSPGAIVCGFSKVSSNNFIGAGAIIVDHCTVPANSFIKANTVFNGR